MVVYPASGILLGVVIYMCIVYHRGTVVLFDLASRFVLISLK